MNSLKQAKYRLLLGAVALVLGLLTFAACGGETVVERVVETVVVEKEVEGKTVTVVETVVVEKPVTKVEKVVETVVVEKEVTRTERVVETVVVEREVEGKTVKVVETVVVEKPVTRVEKVVETVVVEKQVTVTEKVVETVVVEKRVVEVATVAPAPTIPPAQRVKRVIVGHDEPYALIDHINPYIGGRGVDLAGGSLYDRLNDLDDTLAPVSRLGTGWSVSSDGTQWTYTLREGVSFKNGQPFTSADVLYSWQRLLDEETAYFRSATVPGMSADGLEAVDDFTFRFNLATPNFLLPMQISNTITVIIPDGATDDALKAADMGTGPFIFENFVPNSEVWVWKRNPNYWEEIKTEEIELQSIPDETARIAAIKTGEVDLITSIGGAVRVSQAGALEADPNVNLLVGVPAVGLTMRMRVDLEPFTDVRLRQAMRHILDREFLASTVLQNFALPGNDTPIPLSWPSSWTSDPPQQDIDKAKELLAEVGYDENNPLEVELFAGDVHPGAMEMVQAYQEMASAAGVKVNILVAPKDQYWDFSGDKPFAISAWGVRIPGLIYNLVFKCAGPWGDTNWCNEEFDALVEEAEGTADTAARDELYRKAGAILAEESSTMFPVFTLAVDAVRTDCQGFEPPFPFYERDFENLECQR